MKFIGLLMTSGEDDVLEQTLAHNAEFVDAFYVLDGNTDTSFAICMEHPKGRRWVPDNALPVKYGYPVRDGARQHLLELAMAHHGPDNWFLLLHGDEFWDQDPRDLPQLHPDADGFMFRLPLYFPRDGEPWDDTRAPLDQLRWRLGPGWPEFRMFRGGPNVRFDPTQHFNVTPTGLTAIVQTDRTIRHYPYRDLTYDTSLVGADRTLAL